MQTPAEKRKVDYLRISVTDLCNLRCVYCMPPQGVKKISHVEILSFEEILKIIQVALRIGIVNFRLTGGEPLIRKGVLKLVAEIGKIPGINDFSLTTNGLLLPQFAGALKKAGVQRINISLDSVNPSTFHQITRGGNLSQALRGIDAARRSGFKEIKLNTVILRGINEADIFPLLEFAREKRLIVRFIELMPISGEVIEGENRFLSGVEVKKRIEKRWPLKLIGVHPGCGPAEYYRTADQELTIGFIAPITSQFCHLCNRMRLTAEGKLRPCLASDYELDLRGVIRRGGGDREIQAVLRQGIEAKLTGQGFGQQKEFKRKMVAIGG